MHNKVPKYAASSWQSGREKRAGRPCESRTTTATADGDKTKQPSTITVKGSHEVEPKGIEPSTSRMPSANLNRLKTFENHGFNAVFSMSSYGLICCTSMQKNA
jgi:hypothetical protein